MIIEEILKLDFFERLRINFQKFKLKVNGVKIYFFLKEVYICNLYLVYKFIIFEVV